MNLEAKYAVFKQNETVSESIFKDIVTFSFLAFCIYLSHGSTWWTLVTGIMFMLFMFGRLAAAFTKVRHEFRTKEDLQAWVNALDDS